MDVDWPSIVFQQAVLDRIERLAGQRLFDDVLAVEAQTYVLDKLAENDWQRCQAFKGRSSPETFIYVVSSRLVEEFARTKFGRPRPPSWLKRQGEFWVSIWRQVCLERRPVQTVIDGAVVSESVTQVTVEDVIRTIKARIPGCGERTMPQSVDLDIELSTEDPATLESAMEAETLEALLKSLACLLDKPNSDTISGHDANTEALSRFWDAAQLSAEEFLLLKLLYGEGVSAAKAARLMGLKAHEPGRMHARILQRLRACAEDLDLKVDEFF